MKRISCWLVLSFCVLFAQNDMPGKNSLDILALYDPFFDYNIFQADQKLFLQAMLGSRVKINGKWYQEKDFIDQAQIIEIAKDYVLIEEDDQRYQIHLQRLNHKVLVY